MMGGSTSPKKTWAESTDVMVETCGKILHILFMKVRAMPSTSRKDVYETLIFSDKRLTMTPTKIKIRNT